MRKDIGHRGSPHLFRKMKNSMVRKLKTSDFFEGNIRTFDAKHPYFQSKKSVVLQLPDRRLSPPKIFFSKKLLHFLHQGTKTLVFTRDFG